MGLGERLCEILGKKEAWYQVARGISRRRRSLRISLFMMKLAKVNVTVSPIDLSSRAAPRRASEQSEPRYFLQLVQMFSSKNTRMTFWRVNSTLFYTSLFLLGHVILACDCKQLFEEVIKSSAVFSVSCKIASLPHSVSRSFSLSTRLLCAQN